MLELINSLKIDMTKNLLLVLCDTLFQLFSGYTERSNVTKTQISELQKASFFSFLFFKTKERLLKIVQVYFMHQWK